MRCKYLEVSKCRVKKERERERTHKHEAQVREVTLNRVKELIDTHTDRCNVLCACRIDTLFSTDIAYPQLRCLYNPKTKQDKTTKGTNIFGGFDCEPGK